ncbi:MAG: nitroreductase [Firmicutes bacterium]|nr:nitroreductase [Bacillota bacterium]
MNVFDAIASRRAIRSYLDKPIPKEILDKLLTAMRLAPSGNNKQPCRYVVIQDEKIKSELVTKACHQDFIAQAPVVIAVCCPPGNDINAAITVDHLTLQATEEGLGTCWIRWFEKDIAAQVLGLPEGMEVAVIVPVGYAAEQPEPTERLELAELIHYDRW